MAKFRYNAYAHIKGEIDIPGVHWSALDSYNLGAFLMEKMNLKLGELGKCTDVITDERFAHFEDCGYETNPESAEFKKYQTGVNRYCTRCGAYLSDEEFENHTIRFCYYCGAPIKQEENHEN